MACFECGGPNDLFLEVEGNIRILCHRCYYQPDECPHDEMAEHLDSALTFCKRCRTVWDRSEKISALADEFNGRWYIARPVQLP